MKSKLILILAMVSIIAILIPTVGVFADEQFWTGTSQTTVIETLQVLGSETGSPLENNYVLAPLTINRGEAFTKSLWVKNTSTVADYTITPVFASSDPAIVCATLAPKVVLKGTTVKFDFVITGVTAGTPYAIRLSFEHN